MGKDVVSSNGRPFERFGFLCPMGERVAKRVPAFRCRKGVYRWVALYFRA